MIKLYFDGGCGPKNPGGVAAYGFCVEDGDTILYTAGDVVGEGDGMTNNVAEYHGIINGMRYLIENELHKGIVHIYGDSNTIVNMVNKDWGWKGNKWKPHLNSPHLQPLLHEAISLKEQIPLSELSWIPRSRNKTADEIASIAIREYLKERNSVTS